MTIGGGERPGQNQKKGWEGAAEQMVTVSSARGYVFIILNNKAVVIIMLSLSMLSPCLLAHDSVDLLDRL